MHIEIRTERKEDFAEIYQLVASAFKQDFESELIEKIRKGLTYVPELALIAEENGRLVGYILFSKIKIVGKGVAYDTLALAPLAVDPLYQKQGIGSMLVTDGLERAKVLGFLSVIVLGDPNYYSRFGFQKASKWHIQCPFEVPEEAFMAIELAEGALQEKKGVVDYSKVFTEM